MKIVLIGLPGSGKTTQAKKLSEFLGIEHISLRNLVKSAGILKEIGSWQPLEDNLAVELCESATEEKDSFILEGFPRSRKQHELLFFPDAIYVLIDICWNESRKRMTKRGDDQEAIIARWAVEKDRFFPLVEVVNFHFIIDGMLPEEVIFSKLKILEYHKHLA